MGKSERNNNAYWQGFDDFEAGLGEHECRYVMVEARADWLEGYLDARDAAWRDRGRF